MIAVIEPYEERQTELENNIREIFEQKYLSDKSNEESKERTLFYKGLNFLFKISLFIIFVFLIICSLFELLQQKFFELF